MKNKIDKKLIYIGLAFLVVGLFLGWIFFGSDTSRIEEAEGEAVAEHVHDGEEGETIWTCSMHPQIRQTEPGQCPICGMDLVPLSAEGGNVVGEDEIQMSEAAMKIAEVQTVAVQRTSPSKEIYMSGTVEADERRISEITARNPGRIEQLYVNFTGQQVRKGQKLASIYSPELVTAQRELLEAESFRESNPSFFESAMNRLRLWGLTDEQIQRILNRGEPQYNFDVVSPQSGTVTSRNVSTGDYVQEGQSMFEIANLSKVWILFDAYESDLPWVQEGDEITFSVGSMPGQTFTSEITFVDPVINPQTRVASIRTEVNNPDNQLKPGMFAQGRLESSLPGVENALLIPKSSVLWTGKRAVVYVRSPEHEQPTFEFREILLGPEAGAQYVVNEGLQEGEEVVANGMFKVDAAAQLQGKTSMMNPRAAVGAAPDMSGMNMGDQAAVTEQQISTAEYVESEVVDFSDQAPEAFRIQLNKVIDAYLALKEALVEADKAAAARQNTALLDALEQVDGKLLKGTAREFWQEKERFLIEHARLGKEATDIEEKRENFVFLSHPLIKVVEAFGVSKEPLYISYCPMANNNRGAFWLSEIEEIQNPFMPEAMRSCGEVRKVIE